MDNHIYVYVNNVEYNYLIVEKLYSLAMKRIISWDNYNQAADMFTSLPRDMVQIDLSYLFPVYDKKQKLLKDPLLKYIIRDELFQKTGHKVVSCDLACIQYDGQNVDIKDLDKHYVYMHIENNDTNIDDIGANNMVDDEMGDDDVYED